MALLDKLFKSQESIQDQTDDQTKLCTWIRSRLEEIRRSSSRTASEGIWLTNCAYLVGFDGIYYDTQSAQFRTSRSNNQNLRKYRINVNVILPTIQNRLARLCKSPPKWEVRPKSDDIEDKEASRLTQQVLGMIYDKEKINEKRIPLYMWVQQAGHAFIKVCWDDQKGKAIVDPTTNKLSYEGDIRVDVVSPFEVFVDPLATTMDEATYLFHAKVRKLDYFKSRYKNGNLVKEEGVWLLSLQNEMKANNVTTFGKGDGSSSEKTENTAIEIVYYEKRSEDHPMGRQVTVANGILLENKELPVGEIPLAKFDDVVIGGKFLSESIITHMRPMQDQYSRVVSMRAAWTNKLLAGKYLAAKGHGLSMESLNDQSGEVIEYDNKPNVPPPQAVVVPQIPAYAYKEEEALKSQMLDISGINEISRATMPSSNMPAKGMELLQEQDDTRIGIVTENHENAWAVVLRLCAMYAQEFYKTPRLLKVAGKNLEYTVKEFVGADMKENDDVTVVRGSTIPGSRSLKRQEIVNAYNLGLLGDPQDPKVREKVLGAMEFGFTAEVWEDYAADSAQIKRQVEEIKKGLKPAAQEWDNHLLHMDVKNRLRKSDEFIVMTPESQQILIDDIRAHIQFISKLTNPQGPLDKAHLESSTSNAQDEISQIDEVPEEHLQLGEIAQ